MAAIEPFEAQRTFDCTTEQVALARRWVTDALADAAFDDEAIGDVKVAVSEAVTNIINHAAGDHGDGGCIDASLRIDDAGMLLVLRDYGKCFDLSGYNPPDLDVLAPGGYGIMLMNELMDDVEYVSLDRGTELRMFKRRGGPAE